MRIPVQTDISVAPSITPGVRMSSPDASNPAATQLQGLSQAVSSVGDAAARIQIDKLGEINRNLHDEAAQQAASKMLELESSYKQRRRGDALPSGPDGKPLDEEYDAQYSKALQEIADKLPNQAVKEQFGHTAMALRGQFRRGATAWMAEQANEWNDSVQVGNVATGATLMAEPDPEKQALGRQLVVNSIPQMNVNRGKAAPDLQAEVAKALTPAYARRIDAMVKAGQIDEARKVFADASAAGDITLEGKAILSERLTVSARHLDAMSAVDSVTATPTWTVADAERQLRDKFGSDPETLQAARSELRYRDSVRDDDRKNMEVSLSAPAEQELADALRAGRPVSMGSRSLTSLMGIDGNKLYRHYSALFSSHNEQLIAHAQARQERMRSLMVTGSEQNAASILFDMSANPDAYRGKSIVPDLRKMMANEQLRPADSLRIQQQWEKVQKGESTPEMATFGTAEQYLNDLLSGSYISAGAGSRPKEFSELNEKEQSALKAQMRAEINRNLQLAQRVDGVKYTGQEIRKVVENAFRKATLVDRSGIFGGFQKTESPMLVVDPSGMGSRTQDMLITRRYDAIPAKTRGTIEAALRKNGRPATKASVIEYFNALNK